MVDTYKPMDVFDSMTECTFILKPPSQQSQKQMQQPQKKSRAKGAAGRRSSLAVGREDSADRDISANGGFVPLLQGKEPIESMELRRQLFADMWTPLERLLSDTEKKVNNEGVTEVCNFVAASYTRVETAEKGQLASPFAEIATAVVFSGVNTGDHSNLFQSLQDQLYKNDHYVVLLESQYCTSLPNMLKSMLDQVAAGLGVGASGGSKGRAGGGSGTGFKGIPYDMSLLQVWWDEASPRKDSRIVVILQDFEGFGPLVVDDFIRIATNYCKDVPIVVVFGLATSYECVHQSLTKASISMLNVERFNLQRSKQCIDTVIRSVFVESASMLSFGAEAYKSLLDQFLLYSFSITGFVKKLKFAIMDFFYAQPLSVLSAMISRLDQGGSDTAFSIGECPIRLCQEQIELIRMQRSVQRFFDKKVETDGDDGRKYAVKALVDDDFLQDSVLPEMLRHLASYRQSYSLGISMVQAIQDTMPESQRKPLRTLHYYGISQLFDEGSHWKTLSAAIRRMKVPEMVLLLKSLDSIVSAAGSLDLLYVESSGTDIVSLLQQARELVADPDQTLKDEGYGEGKTFPDAPSKRIRTRTDMDNRPFLLFDNSSTDQELRALDIICGYIESILRACLSPYQNVPLYEVFYYRHSFLLDTTFSAQPRAAVQTALGKSQYYVDCDCCNGSSAPGDSDQDDEADERIMPSMNDTSIAYRLHQECRRMINLYDWYSAFASVVEQESAFMPKAPSQSEIQARFVRASEEMRFLGFIKSTQRKTDHVVRLTWGH
ncbi:Origin recognition complex subunit 3 [Coemansia erecta]|uniref:Origin recognition complex subunit 3 n=1 Tax=Coemansia erecta TaxID=147472 RepID=A0A9W7XZD2_9FUNG|nr:Origin recognition complex subunit 3 [Coemansia erecta]